MYVFLLLKVDKKPNTSLIDKFVFGGINKYL